MCEFFGEDPSQNKPEDFFGIIDSFLTAMADAKAENERIKRQKEEEEKRQALEESVRRMHVLHYFTKLLIHLDTNITVVWTSPDIAKLNQI